MNQTINEDFMGPWKNLLKAPFPAVVNSKQTEALVKYYKEEQENLLKVMTAWQDYVKNNKPNGNGGNIGKRWQQYLESSQDLIDSLDSCRQNRRKALFSFFKALAPQIPTEDSSTKKVAEQK